MCGKLAQANEPDNNLSKSNDKRKDMEELNLDKEGSLEDKNISTWHLGKQEYQVNSDSFLDIKGNRYAARNMGEINGFVTKEDSMDAKACTLPYAKSPLEPQWREERKGLYADESVMDCEMPEVVIFPLERNYMVVKDICIDGKIPSQNKCSVENCDLDHNIISCILNSDMDKYSSKSAKEVVNHCGSMNFSMEPEGHFDDMEGSGSPIETITGRLLDVRELNTNCSHLQISNSTGCKGEQTDHEVPSKGAILATSTASFATKARHSNRHANESASKLEVETRSTTSDCDSLVTAISGSESESLIVSTQKYDNAESSFSAVGTLSDPLVYSGPLSYSGRISLRSNSSDSTRSFAFPVLPSEWNGSPVRMADADRRRLKKHRRWTAFYCCWTDHRGTL